MDVARTFTLEVDISVNIEPATSFKQCSLIVEARMREIIDLMLNIKDVNVVAGRLGTEEKDDQVHERAGKSFV